MNIKSPIHIECRISTVRIREDGLLHVEIRPDEIFDVSDVEELVAAAREIGSGKKMLNLIIVGNGTVPTNNARELAYTERCCLYKLADAFVISSFAQKIVGNFIMKIQRPMVPTKVFTQQDEAIHWLKGLDLE